MELTTFIIILVCAIIVSNILDSAFPALPLSLIQIGFGVIIAFTMIETRIEIEPEIFLGVLVAPLLYREAEETDLASMWKVRKEVIFMAFALVFVTVLAVGFSINYFVAVIPLAACFCLGAILGPTDAIAVSSLSKRVDIDNKVMSILKGEFLINDASGVIAFNFAAIMLTTGAFSLGRASLSFLLVALGGLVVGFVLGTAKNHILRTLKRAHIKNTAAFMIIELLTPFVCFFVAEALGVSGIIAAVTAGVRQAFMFRRIDIFEARFAVVKKTLWEMITVVFNSFIFILLGFELPMIVTAVQEHEELPIAVAMLVGLFVIVIVYAVRYIGVLVAAPEMPGENLKERTRNRIVLVISGAKGTVSLAIAFALPLVIADGLIFVERDLVMFIAACAIIYSLIIATVFLPLVAKTRVHKPKYEARIAVIKSFIDRIENSGSECSGAVAMRLKNRVFEMELEDNKLWKARRYSRIRRMFFETESQVLEKKIRARKYKRTEVDAYNRVFAVLGGIQNDVSLFRSIKLRRSQRNHIMPVKEKYEIGFERIEEIFWETLDEVIAVLNKKLDEIESQMLSRVIEERIDSVNNIVKRTYGDDSLYEFTMLYNREVKEAYEIEREVLDEFMRDGRISEKEADELRIEINMLENYMIEEIQYSEESKFMFDVATRRRGYHGPKKDK